MRLLLSNTLKCNTPVDHCLLHLCYSLPSAVVINPYTLYLQMRCPHKAEFISCLVEHPSPHIKHTHETHTFASPSVHQYFSNPLLSLSGVFEFVCLCVILCVHVYVCVLWKAAGFIFCLCVMWRKQRQRSRGPSLRCSRTVNTVPLQRENPCWLPACVNPIAFTN